MTDDEFLAACEARATKMRHAVVRPFPIEKGGTPNERCWRDIAASLQRKARALLDEQGRLIAMVRERDARVVADAAMVERVALLRRLEWSSGERTHYSCCPVCKADEDDKEHVPNCALAEALK